MKQLGNLSIVCAHRPDVVMQIYGGQVSVHVGEGPERTSLFAAWDDDEVIQHIIHELNFGATLSRKNATVRRMPRDQKLESAETRAAARNPSANRRSLPNGVHQSTA